MESSVLYDPDSHTILVMLVGAIDEVTMNETAAKARRVAEEHACFNVLADLRQARSAVSTVAIFGRAKESQQLYGRKTQDSKRALVVAENSEDAIFYETVSQNRGQNVRLFHDIDEAKRWLSS